MMAARGLFHTIHPHDLTPETLAGTITRLLDDGVPFDARNLPPLTGASRAAERMLAEV